MLRLETRVTLELLGGALLRQADQPPWRLERKSAALLAYLALEGATSRSLLAGLLWPDSLEVTARGNLRQLLRRLRDGAGGVIAGDDPLMLSADIAVDAVQLELTAFAGDDAAVVASSRELLEGLDFEDCADLLDWLLAKRELLSALRVAALERLTDASQKNGDLRTALLHAEKLLELDAVSEVAHRRVMRLHYLNGDRGASMRAYQRCCEVMQRELGVAPLPETTALAGSISAGQPLESSIRVRPELPLSVQRPPLLVGREAEWAALESAWDAGLGIAVSGEAGVGKSRLTLEFVASKGRYTLVQGRPGDDGVPYSTLARSLRQTLGDHPELELAPWVRLELSRLIPSLTTQTPPAISSDEGKLRFFESMAAALEPLIEAGLVALVMEDLQFADAASLEAGQYLATRFVAPSGVSRLRSLSTYRSGELRGDTEALIQQGVSAGQVALIDVKPLAQPQLEALLAGLGVALPSGLPALLGRHSGGNPLFALETLRSLIERGELQRELPAHLPVPKRLEALVTQRLERLTPNAQRTAQVAAIAGEDFTLELAAFALDCKALELQAALAELEQAQIMQRERFQHDLLLEAVRAGISSSVKRFLHRTCAAFLEEHGDPARVAQHWLEAGEYDRAVPAMIAAAENTQGMGQNFEAIKLLEQAIGLPASLNQLHRAQSLLGGCYTLASRFSDAEKILEPLLEVVSDPEAHWLTLDHLCFLHLSKGSLDTARKFGLQALQLAEQHGVKSNLDDTRYKLGVIAIQEAEYEKALQLIEPVVQAWRQQPFHLNFLYALGAMGMTLFHLERQSESELYDDEMMRHARAMGADAIIINHVSNLLYRDFLSGDASKSIALAENLLSDLELRHSKEDSSQLSNNLAGIYLRSAQPEHAIRHYQKVADGANTLFHCIAFANLAILYFQTLALEPAQSNLARALTLATDTDHPNARYAVIRAVYTLGTPEQREIVKSYLETLNFEALPSSYRSELDELIEVKGSSAAKL